jgi:hypothetical protein
MSNLQEEGALLTRAVPAATSQTLEDAAGPRPQNMSDEVRDWMGLLSLTTRVHDVALSVLPTHRSCHVEWAETAVAAARRIAVVFILPVYAFLSFFLS